MTPEVDMELVRRRYAAGVSIRKLSAQTGVPYATLHRYMRADGIKFRPRGARAKGFVPA